ncbi:MAG TPA: FkbM family methyltransferase, partial [Candidatus Paceibacterota bacterium]
FVKTKVRTFTLDSIKELGVDRAPDIIKIDVEGAEALVLKGARKTITKHRPLILLEIHSIINMFNVLSFLASVSYETEMLKKEKDGRCFIEARSKKQEGQ